MQLGRGGKVNSTSSKSSTGSSTLSSSTPASTSTHSTASTSVRAWDQPPAIAAAANKSTNNEAAASSNTDDRKRVNYFFFSLIGQLVVLQLRDGSVLEGLLQTVKLRDGGCEYHLNLAQLQPETFAKSRQQAKLHPILYPDSNNANNNSTNTSTSSSSSSSSSTKTDKQWTRNTQPWSSTRSVDSSDVIQMRTFNHSFADPANSRTSTNANANTFATDTQISRGETRDRELQKWQSDQSEDRVNGVSLSLDDHSNNTKWDQFDVHEKMTKQKSSFKFDDYSTPLDKNSDFYKMNEAK
jgi:hypothetical protein